MIPKIVSYDAVVSVPGGKLKVAMDDWYSDGAIKYRLCRGLHVEEEELLGVVAEFSSKEGGLNNNRLKGDLKEYGVLGVSVG